MQVLVRYWFTYIYLCIIVITLRLLTGWEGKWRELIPMGWGGSHRELKAKPRVLARRVHVPCGRDDGCSVQATRPASAEGDT